MRRKVRQPLGERQREVLQAIAKHSGTWRVGCGWLWDSYTSTITICESLVRRGLLRKETLSEPVESILHTSRDIYHITDSGREEASK